VRPTPQTSLDETVVEHAELAEALEARERLKDRRSKLNRDYQEADEHAKTLVGQLDLADGDTVRVGRFRISRTAVAGRTVAFETGERSRLTISMLDEDAP
jgi:hypothetical protein